MVFVQRADVAADFLSVAAAIVAVHVLLWVSMRYSVVILRVLRESGILLVTRIAGLLLAAIAVQLVADAVRAFVSG
jgi:multiple antibiotic resistance protein